mgnify:CR=1 FL=1
MEVDQYATITEDGDRVEIAYWRKRDDLHVWMEDLWNNKGGNGEFDGIEVELTLQDLDQLEVDVNNENLSQDEYQKSKDLSFIEDARARIAQGHNVFYSWGNGVSRL